MSSGRQPDWPAQRRIRSERAEEREARRQPDGRQDRAVAPPVESAEAEPRHKSNRAAHRLLARRRRSRGSGADAERPVPPRVPTPGPAAVKCSVKPDVHQPADAVVRGDSLRVIQSILWIVRFAHGFIGTKGAFLKRIRTEVTREIPVSGRSPDDNPSRRSPAMPDGSIWHARRARLARRGARAWCGRVRPTGKASG